jgi:hypothetical protein
VFPFPFPLTVLGSVHRGGLDNHSIYRVDGGEVPRVWYLTDLRIRRLIYCGFSNRKTRGEARNGNHYLGFGGSGLSFTGYSGRANQALLTYLRISDFLILKQ